MRVELVTILKRQATKLLAEVRKTKAPILITEHGQPAAFLVAVEDYEFMQQRMEILEGIGNSRDNLLNSKSVFGRIKTPSPPKLRYQELD